MLDIKLKNRHKLVVVILVVIITCLSALSVTERYSDWHYDIDGQINQEYKEMVTSQTFFEYFVEMAYILYNSQENSVLAERAMNEQLDDMKKSYDQFYPYVDYAVFDENENRIESIPSSGVFSTNTANLKIYQTAVILRYYENGEPYVQFVKGEYLEEQEIMLRSVANSREDIQKDYAVNIYNEKGDMQTVNLKAPRNCIFVVAMTEVNQKLFLSEVWGVDEASVPDSMVLWILTVALIVAAFAWILPRFHFFQTGNEKIFHVPLEIAGVILLVTMGATVSFGWNRVIKNYGAWWWYDLFVWMAAFAIVYWASGCLRPITELGVKSYFKERTLTGIYGNKIRGAFRNGWMRIKQWFGKLYHLFEEIDLTQKNDKTLLKIVLVNFLVLSLVCMMWMFGIIALILYSVVLFFVLRKLYNRMQEKYMILLAAANEIAEGNLEREIDEELGIFNPLKKELMKIQSGFKNAVEKEVKSERMKTELITNVSHDLKTPLTAIITYVNLLKEEQEEEKRKEYIEVLDKKSHRLKVLIEDLFEISKASSKNVTLHIMDVDIVSLFQQVKFEMEDKFEGTGLEFRCNYEEAVIVPLDSQKTYRIFENLLVNVAKYALSNTRVYVDIFREGEAAVFRMKNISASELNFGVSEITDRFARGDASRNTEGSGLGLAIVKSFTELQKGEFKIEIDGDLFKVEVKFEEK